MSAARRWSTCRSRSSSGWPPLAGYAGGRAGQHDRAWTSDQISEEGRKRLKRSGFAPPPKGNLIRLEPLVECPYCGSRNTVLENAFGPTLCRAIYYCKGCRQPFEQFKAV